MDASCVNTYNENSKAIHSPNYPGKYPKRKHCTWHVAAPIGFNIRIKRFSYSMDYDTDCLKIYDGSSNRSGRVANLCEMNEYSGMTSTTNNLFFVFDSDDFFEFEGFQLMLALIGMKMDYIINLDQLIESKGRKMNRVLIS